MTCVANSLDFILLYSKQAFSHTGIGDSFPPEIYPKTKFYIRQNKIWFLAVYAKPMTQNPKWTKAHNIW